MTGIEQLRKMGADAVRGGEVGRAICDIADQIERERECERDTIENLRLELGEARDEAAWVREHGGMETVEARLMPEGMEWLLEVWPRWSNGEYCKFGDWWTSDRYGDYEPRQLRRLVIYTPELLDEWEQGDGESYGYEWDFMRPSELDYQPDKVEPPETVDTWDRIEEDISDLPCSDYCDIYRIDASDTSYEHAMARDLVRRCKELAEKENRNE